MRIFNTLTRSVEEFKPLSPPQVGMYTCGPTVYGHLHIGNFRTMLLSDLLLRVLLANDYQVKSVRNITDIEDKIIKNAAERNITISELTDEFTQAYFNDLNKLNILPVDVSPKATEHVGKMIKYVESLADQGFAYVEEDGSVYFDISKFPEYGKLSRLDKRELKTGTRILSDEYEKDSAQDFSLWKGVAPDEFGYDSPWGRGRPGWHIECSVMSQEYLGETFDIHVGGIDLMFPHHENEIAQSEAKTGEPFVKYFVHGEMMMVDGQKMAKSLKNFYTIKDLEDKGFDPIAFRYLTMTAHYRDKLNFTWESLQAAQMALSKLREEVRAWEQPGGEPSEFYHQFLEFANNDLGLPQAVAVMWKMIASDHTTSSKARDLLEMDKILGLGLDQFIAKPLEIPAEVQSLVEKREEARQNKDFEKSDQLRDEINKHGYDVLDTSNGAKIKKTILKI